MIKQYPILADLHTHSISSGHGSRDTICQMALAASLAGLQLMGISEHGPATPGSVLPSYFSGIRLAPRKRWGVNFVYGAEVNILNLEGDVDLPWEILSALDYAIISIHPPQFTPWEVPDLTQAYLSAFRHPKVRFLGHIDDARFPVDFERLLKAAQAADIYPEINNNSLTPQAYRVDGQKNCRQLLKICKRLQLPVLLSSDSHGVAQVGDMGYALSLLEECQFPPSLVLNSDPVLLQQILKRPSRNCRNRKI
ncbi:MAG: phosphatase [Lachnospiraceae bacterium]|nr:phosphatase [Lachnospiraceae bacterium]